MKNVLLKATVAMAIGTHTLENENNLFAFASETYKHQGSQVGPMHNNFNTKSMKNGEYNQSPCPSYTHTHTPISMLKGLSPTNQISSGFLAHGKTISLTRYWMYVELLPT